MDIKTYSKTFTEKAENVGFSKENIEKCLMYAEILISNNVPIIYNLTHLSKLVGIEKNYIVQAAVTSKHSPAYYRYYNVKKKNGQGYREIMEPLPNLKQIQYWILKNILETQSPSPYAKAYIKKRGVKHNVRFHVGQKKVFSLDIKDFFPTIKFFSIKSIFTDLGYSDYISNYLAKLCCLQDKLPQGAPTSPYISNLVLSEIDGKISSYCRENSIRYTRYADDMTFSGSDFSINDLKNIVIEAFRGDPNGFELNFRKIKLMKENQKQIVTGVVVNKKIQLDRETRKEIRKDIYYIKKFGLESHMLRKGVSKSFYLNHILGKISYGLYLNPKDIKLMEYHKYLSDLHRNR